MGAPARGGGAAIRAREDGDGMCPSGEVIADDAPHPLTRMLRDAAQGAFPPEDGQAEVVAPLPPPGGEWVVSFTAHAVIATALPEAEVMAQRPDGLGGALTPRFLSWLAGRGGHVGCQDAVLVARGHGGPEDRLPRRVDLEQHPRVRHARRLRSRVSVHGDERGFVTLGTGLAGLTEVSVEVTVDGVRGHGRALVSDALGLVGAGEIVIAQVTPGNARSLRAFLAAGFVPVGSAVAIERR